MSGNRAAGHAISLQPSSIMPSITFYRQVRADGGVRMGLDGGRGLSLSQFEPGSHNDDPSLVWYVDVTFEAPRLPNNREALCEWLASRAAQVAELLEAIAEGLPAGVDGEGPLKLSRSLPNRVRLTIACSAMKRVTARRLSAILREVGANFRQYVEELAMVPVNG